MMTIVRLLFVLVLLVSSGDLVRAQESGIEISDLSVESAYPDGMTFHVNATSSVPIVKAELLYTRAEQETLQLEAKPIVPATEIDHTLQVDFLNSFLPPGIQITYRWRLTDQNGDTVESDPRTVDWVDSRFDWKQISTAQVVVFSYAADEGFAESVLETAQSTIDRLQSDFGVERSRQIRLWVYDSRSDFEGSQAPNNQEWVVGTAYPDLQVILAVLPAGEESEVDRVVPHEISHQVLRQATQNPFNTPPLWFDEGLAGLAQLAGTDHMTALVESAAEEGRLQSVRSLTSEFPYNSSGASLAYAESFTLVRFIIERWGNAGISAIIDAYRAGVTHDEAFVAAIGVTIDELDRLWKESLDYPGDSEIAAGSSDFGHQSGTTELITNISAIMLVVAAFASATAMIRRYRSYKPSDDEVFAAINAA